MAVSLSTNAVKLYGPATGQYLGDCLGHTNTVSDISFPDASSPNILCSSSADGTVRAWDIRSRKEVATFRTENQELWSFDIGGSNENLVAAGGNAAVTLLIFLGPETCLFVTRECRGDLFLQSYFLLESDQKRLCSQEVVAPINDTHVQLNQAMRCSSTDGQNQNVLMKVDSTLMQHEGSVSKHSVIYA